jgi:hypothetical protein
VPARSPLTRNHVALGRSHRAECGCIEPLFGPSIPVIRYRPPRQICPAVTMTESAMPALSNPRHERFAQELATGKSATEALAASGYQSDRRNGTRLTTPWSGTGRTTPPRSRPPRGHRIAGRDGGNVPWRAGRGAPRRAWRRTGRIWRAVPGDHAGCDWSCRTECTRHGSSQPYLPLRRKDARRTSI